MAPADALLVGRVARAHGNRGQVIVNLETDFPEERFVVGQPLQVEQHGRSTERRITSVRFHQRRPIIGFEGVETMDDAEALAGAELKVPASAVAPLAVGIFYHHDLVGCEVRDTSGRSLGIVTRVDGPMERSTLVVDAPGGEVLVPLVAGICMEVDPKAKVIVVNPPEGLIELNERGR
jgi:16S rRNA processing protein RimM